MKKELEKLTDKELVDLADELNQTTFKESSIVRKLINGKLNISESATQFQVAVLGLNAELVQVLSERLYCCSPHIER